MSDVTYIKQLEEQIEKLHAKLAKLEHDADEHIGFKADLAEFSAAFLGETQDEMSIKNNLGPFIKRYRQKVPKDVVEVWKNIVTRMDYNTQQEYDDEQF